MKKIPEKIFKKIIQYLAKMTIWRFEPRVVAVTGSVGKSAAVEAIRAVLSSPNSKGAAKKTRASSRYLENNLAVPLAILGDWQEKDLMLFSKAKFKKNNCFKKLIFGIKVFFPSLWKIFFARHDEYPEVLVLEYGSRKPGDIKYLLEIAEPAVSVVTAVGELPDHLEFWTSPEALYREKSKIVEHLGGNGFAVLNYDDENVLRMKERTRGKVITFGFEDGADLKIINLEVQCGAEPPFGVSFKLNYGGSFVPVVLSNVFGKAEAYASAAAACVGLIFDLNLVEISEALRQNYRSIPEGMHFVKGIKDTYIIDDSYSASPNSVQEAFQVLQALPGSRKIAVLGDMLELGKYSIEAHEAIGELAGRSVDILITVGPRGKFIANGAQSSGMNRQKIISFDTVREAGKNLQDLLKKGDLVLIKASKELRLSEVVEEIKEM